MKPPVPVRVPPTSPDVRRDDALTTAAATSAPAVLTHRATTGWKTCKTRFLPTDDNIRQLLLELPAPSAEQSAMQFEVGDVVGVAFRRGHRKCMFSGTVLDRRAVRDAGGTGTEAVVLCWPECLEELQRRAYHRVAPPANPVIRVTMRPGAVPGETSRSDRRMLTGKLKDLSAGGIQVSTGPDVPFQQHETVSCTFVARPHTEPFVIDATLRRIDPRPGGGRSVGLQFVGLETSAEGKATLQRLAAVVMEFQRARHRRHRPQAPRSN